jgi:hypothetical protein
VLEFLVYTGHVQGFSKVLTIAVRIFGSTVLYSKAGAFY